MQESLDKLLALNTTLAEKVEKLEAENQEMRVNAEDKETKMKAIKEMWLKLHEEAVRKIEEMTDVRDRLRAKGVEEKFFEENTKIGYVTRELLEEVKDPHLPQKKEVKIE